MQSSMRPLRRIPPPALVALTLMSSALLISEPATAEDQPSDEAIMDQRREEARAKYEAGAEAYARGRYKDAVDWFLAADRLAPSASLSFNVARAYERLGDDSSALRWYRDYLRRSPTAPNAEAVRRSIDTLAAALARKGLQQLTILSTPAGATVSVDGQPSGVTPWTSDLVPGEHHVRLTYRGHAEEERIVALGASEPGELSVELRPVSATPEPSTTAQPLLPTASEPPEVDRSTDLGYWPWITVGAGAATLGAALTFELLRRSAEDDAEHAHTQLAFHSAIESMESRKTTARVLAGVGGALVLAGATLIAIDVAGRRRPASVGLACVPGACGLQARGQF